MRNALVRAIVFSTSFLLPLICQAQTSLPPGWSHGDVGAVGLTGSASYTNGTFTVAGSGTAIYGTADSFQFAYLPWSGDGTLVARLASFQGVQSGTSPYAAVMIRETLNANSRDVFTVYRPNWKIQTIWRPSTGGSSSYQDSAITNLPPYWLKIVRSGSTFSSYASPDGIAWTQVGSNHTVTMAQNVYIGLAVGNTVNTSLVTATFDNVSISPSTPPAPVITSVWPAKGMPGFDVLLSGSGFGNSQGTSVVTLNGVVASVNSWNATSISVTIPPGANSGPLSVSVAPAMNTSNPVPFLVTSLQPPWLDLDIGSVGAAGKASYANGTFTVAGSGIQIDGSADSFHFAYQPWSGDGTVVARLANAQGVQSGTSPYVGLIIRETLNANSKDAFTVYRPNWRIQTNWRASTGGSTSYQDSPSASPPFPYWLKIVRNGSTFSSYSSPDGNTWTQVGSNHTITMAQNVYIGFAVSSTVNTSLVTATFDNVSITPVAAAAPVITDINPFSGAVGTPLAISGVNFGTQGTNTVTFNGVTATPSMWSPTAIVVPVPPAATTGNVVVHVGALNSNAAPFTVLTAPTITGLAPTSGPIGTPVTITGGNFGSSQGSSSVKFNGVAAAPATSWGPTSIQVLVPAGATSGNVAVTVSGVTSNVANFTVTSSVPSITNLNPASGPIGSSVAIIGVNFGTSPGTVTFNGRTASTSTWNASNIVATVPAGATSGPVLVTVNGVASNPPNFIVYTVQSGSPTLTVNPRNMNMVVGQTQAIQLLDQNGIAFSNPTWSLANPSIASIVQGAPTLLQATAIGNTTLTGTSPDGRTGSAQVTILAGTSLPIGTVQWEVPSLGITGTGITSIIQAPPTSDPAPAFYVLDSGANGGSGAFRAFTADGQQKWMFTPSAPAGEELALLTADDQGGFIFQRDDWSDFPMLGRVDGNGNQNWLLSTPHSLVSNVAVHPDGTLYLVQPDYLNTGNSPAAVVALDELTGQMKFAIPIPAGTFSGADYAFLDGPQGQQYCTPGTSTATSATSTFGKVTISSDGTVYLPISTMMLSYDAMPCDSSPDPNHPGYPHVVKSTDGLSSVTSYLQVMAIHADGTYSVRQLDSAASSYPGNGAETGPSGVFASGLTGNGATPDGNGGTLLAINLSGGSLPSAFYHDTGSVVTKLNLPINPVGETLLAGGGTAYLAGLTQGSSVPATVAINTANNAINWTYNSTGGSLSLVAVTSDGGVAISNSQAGLIQLDPNGGPSPITSGYTINQASYSWEGDWLALTSLDSGVSQILLPVAVDPASTWATPGGNPSGDESSEALCDCLVETTDPAPPPPPSTCPICNLAGNTLPATQPPSCASTPGTSSTYLILVGDPSTDPQGDHNAGNLFNLAAQTQANSLQAQGHPVVACRVSTIQQFNQALTTKGLIDGGVIFFGHAGHLHRADLPGLVYYSLVSVGQGTDDSANISYINVGTLSNTQLGSNVTITLNACRAGKSLSPGQPPIAFQMANQLRRDVQAYPVGMYFTQNPNDAHRGGIGQAPSSLPMYMLPEGRIPKPNPTIFIPH